MDKDKTDSAQRAKRPYRKPALVVVALRPDEAVLGACKTSSGAGPGTPGSCSTLTCRTRGS